MLILKIQQLLVIVTLFLISSCGPGNPSTVKAGIVKDSTVQIAPVVRDKQIVFFGNSITAGYGLRFGESFTNLIQQRLDSLHLPYRSVNAGLSGETSTGGLARISWVLRQPVDIFVLELGGNDGLRGIPLSLTAQNLQSIIDSVRGKYPLSKIVLAGMEIPPNLGTTYTREFHELFPTLARKHNALLIPFLLEGVGGIDSLNQADGIHPNAAGEKIVAENAWKVLKSIL
jgi:acyl-CoA thioesterase-1